MDYSHEFTVQGAVAAASNDDLEGWVSAFLASPGSDNEALVDLLATGRNCWMGPVLLPFDQLHRLAGPPDQPTLGRLDEDDLETVDAMAESIDYGWDPAPLVVSYRNGQFIVEDGNHRTEGLRRAGETGYWCVVCAEDAMELKNRIDEFETP